MSLGRSRVTSPGGITLTHYFFKLTEHIHYNTPPPAPPLPPSPERRLWPFTPQEEVTVGGGCYCCLSIAK